MRTILEEKEHEQIPRSFMTHRSEDGAWARLSASVGTGVWALVAVAARAGLARIGAIELIFLLAPLVVVPLGMELRRLLPRGSRERSSPPEFMARRAQPFGAACAVVAILLPPGLAAGVLACAWLGVCLLAGWSGVIDAVDSWSDAGEGARATFTLALLVARMDLVVGGGWLVTSRLGMHPLGIQEPIGMLTAVHFHFAGFATAMIAAAMLRFGDGHVRERWLQWVVRFVIGMPYVVAIGFVTSTALKMVAAAIFSVSVAALAVLLRGFGKQARQTEARVLLQVAAGAVFAGMVLSCVYAVTDFRGSDVLTIPEMARTHGILNAVGFCLTALLGWVIEFDGQILDRRER